MRRLFPFIFDVPEALAEILFNTRLLLKGQTRMAQELDDLNSALTDLETSNTAAVEEIETELQTILSTSTGDNPDAAAIEAGVTRIRAVIAAQKQALADVVAATTPPAVALALDSTGLSAATVGAPYSGSLAISGGTAPYSVSTDPTSSNGLSIDANGAVSGTATEAGSADFEVTVTDSATPPASVTDAVSISAS
jgi:hypothetical protein